MNIFETFKNLFGSTPISDTPEGFCPNCWGRQKYQGAFYNAIKNEEITTKNVDQKKGWIEGYVERNLTGIKLVSTDGGLLCNYCHTKYSPTE
ncbi:hypothetical protein ACFOSV_14225 [Algoriphagus namhaensis]|uniref:HNH endonuclease n=1 Tax=Algoriphagus namhaensis TaxID=915353 RepID=A0ABV8AWL9_9BACT